MTGTASTGTASTGTASTGTELVVHRFENMAGGDLDDFRRDTHPDATNREAATEPPACRGPGPEASHATALWLRGMFSELRWEVHEIVAEGDLVVAHVTMTGRHTGEYTTYDAAGGVAMRRAATGRRFAATQTHWYRVADGLLIEHWANRDDLGTAMQLGLLS